MKQIIRKILKEDREEKFIKLLIDKIKSSGAEKDSDLVNKLKQDMALPDSVMEVVNNKIIDVLHNSIGRVIDIHDYDVNIGTYEFTFTLHNITVTTEREYDFETSTQIICEIELDGTVDVYDTTEDGMITIDVNEARLDDELWEVNYEMAEIIKEVWHKMVPDDLYLLSDLEIEIQYK